MSMMNLQVGSHKLIKPWSSYSVKFICMLMFVLADKIASQCSFQYMYHFGDGQTDLGNSIHVNPEKGRNPAAHWPYGFRSPGYPTGRWGEGLTDLDFGGPDFGIPNLKPYLPKNESAGVNDGVTFSVARSPVLDIEFFEARDVTFPPYAVSLNGQFSWFKEYITSICLTRKDIANRLAKSLIYTGDVYGNDIGYALAQGKSFEEVRTYVPLIVKAHINVAKKLIRMGATRIAIPGSGPIGCWPYILTALHSDDPSDYDELGCLISVNNLMQWKNIQLRQAVEDLSNQYPNLYIRYGDFYSGVIQILNQYAIGPNGHLILTSCCGAGGKYNYNSEKFCGSPEAQVCRSPEQYVFWDGLHFTQLAHIRLETIGIAPGLVDLNCTRPSSNKISRI